MIASTTAISQLERTTMKSAITHIVMTLGVAAALAGMFNVPAHAASKSSFDVYTDGARQPDAFTDGARQRDTFTDGARKPDMFTDGARERNAFVDGAHAA